MAIDKVTTASITDANITTAKLAYDAAPFRNIIINGDMSIAQRGTSSAESTTLSFWVRSNKTGTYIANLFDNDNSRHISKSYTISSADTWEKKTITFAGDTSGTFGNDNARSLDLRLYLGAGTNFTSGTLATSWESATNANAAVGQVNLADSTSNEWYVTGIQLEAGTSASDFEFLPVDVNFDRCQRYFQTCFLQFFVLARFKASSGNPINCFIYPKEMRAAPTYGTTGTFTTSSGFAGTPTGADIKTMSIALTGANSESANDIVYANDGSITLDAEL